MNAKLAEMLVSLAISLLSKIDVQALFRVKQNCNAHLLRHVSKEKQSDSDPT